jgi:hypothetical protein
MMGRLFLLGFQDGTDIPALFPWFPGWDIYSCLVSRMGQVFLLGFQDGHIFLLGFEDGTDIPA